jgi:hypothetical protein
LTFPIPRNTKEYQRWREEQYVEDLIQMDEKATAGILQVSIYTLQKWRQQNRGPAYIKAETGGIRYRAVDIKAWQEGNLVLPTNR